MNNGEVAIVGLGATGAFAARAAYDLGFKVTVYVHGNINTTPPGAFWLHWLPEDISGDYAFKDIKIVGKGFSSNYIKLQWGQYWNKNITSSFPVEPVIEKGFNPGEVLPSLVPEEVKVEIVAYPLSDTDVRDLTLGHQYVFQTFPRKEDIELQPERIPYVAAAKFGSINPETNIVVYNGTGNGIIVREAYLFGNHFLEFPKGMEMKEVKSQYNLDGFQTIVLKDLHPDTSPVRVSQGDGVYLIGRFAQWDKRVLSHDCYKIVSNVLSGKRVA